MLLKDLKYNPDNPRTISKQKLEKLKNSIKRFPKMMVLRPIVYRPDNMQVLGGNMRLRALREMGFKEVPDEWVKSAEQLTEEEMREFVIKDNVGFGDWDFDVLSEEWTAEELDAWGLDLPPLFDENTEDAEEDNYKVPETVETDIVPGDVIYIGDHVLYCGDSTQTDSFDKILGDELFDLLLTDPPYNVDYVGATKDKLKIANDSKTEAEFDSFLYEFYTAAYSYAKDGAPAYIFHADSNGHQFRSQFVKAGWYLAQCLIWMKNSMVMGRQDFHWKHEPLLYGWRPKGWKDADSKMPPEKEGVSYYLEDFDGQHMPVLYGWKKGAAHTWYSDRKQTTVLEFDRPSASRQHPTMKPVELLSYLLNCSTRRGAIVCDPFAGSGSTMVTCHQIGRRAVCIETLPKYCQVVIDRMKALDPDISVSVNVKPKKKK